MTAYLLPSLGSDRRAATRLIWPLIWILQERHAMHEFDDTAIASPPALTGSLVFAPTVHSSSVITVSPKRDGGSLFGSLTSDGS